ncbi:unnamed protein product [[Candida] boidinii]|nr:unnamed protein product [[Candida] boidinii]
MIFMMQRLCPLLLRLLLFSLIGGGMGHYQDNSGDQQQDQLQLQLILIENNEFNDSENLKNIHKEGYCVMFGTGGSKTPFGAQLPAVHNFPAPVATQDEIDLLKDILGNSIDDIDWLSNIDTLEELHLCCNGDQLNTLKTNFQRVEPIISSCPACKTNFFKLFIEFTCSPNQSKFLNITESQDSTSMPGEEIVTALSYYVDDFFASNFYDSCKFIKFGATNGFAMDLIGGGAKEYKGFLKFLGDEKPMLGGSPFQINFKYPSDTLFDSAVFKPLNDTVRLCNDDDIRFRCACSDCPDSCPTLPDIKPPGRCKIGGVVPCFSFAVILVYSFLFLFFIGFIIIHKRKNKKFLSRLESSRHFYRYSDNNDRFGGGGNFNDYRRNSILDYLDDFDEEDDYYDDLQNDNDAESLDINHLLLQKTYPINNYLEKWFSKLGLICSLYPYTAISLSLFISLVLSSFTYFIQFETNPVNLWVSSSSDAFQERTIFEEQFSPFYRTEQIYLSYLNNSKSILSEYEIIEWWFEVENEILSLSPLRNNETLETVTYDDICFKPTGDYCILESFTQYYYGDISNLPEIDWKENVEHCAETPVDCLPIFQQPLKKNLVFGGDEDSPVLDSKAIVVTFLLHNDNNQTSDQIINSKIWESTLKTYLINLQDIAYSKGLRLTFSTEISLEEELNKSTTTDIKIIVLSYIFMFAYASLALGGSSLLSLIKNGFQKVNNYHDQDDRYSILREIGKSLIYTRFSLGLIGIFIVLLSVFASAGFWSLFGVKSTLIIAEVIPFLILAIGVDNIFLISNELQIFNNSNYSNESIHERISKTIGKIGPSILLSSTCEFLCISISSFVSMPAVRNFALYSAVSVLFNSLLQLTCFVSVLSLDQRRMEDKRLDLLPFLKLDDIRSHRSSESNSSSVIHGRLPTNSNSNNTNQLVLGSDIEDDSIHNETIQTLNQLLDTSNDNVFNNIMKDYYVPFILSKKVKKSIIFIFTIWFGISLSMIPNIKFGLDQRIAIPSGSYLIDYFNDMYEFLNVGPPIYVVVSDVDVTTRSVQQSLCGRFSTCDEFSLMNIMEKEFEMKNLSTIAEPTASWVDDFFTWLNPTLSECCRFKKNTNETQFCSPFQPSRQCEVCYEDREPGWNITMEGLPEHEEFMKFFNEWIQSPSDPCPLGGKAPYGSSIKVDDETNNITYSYFRTAHIPLKSQNDFINAYRNSLRIIKNLKDNLSIDTIFAYSPFYVFFVQYATIVNLTVKLVLSALVILFLISSILLGSVRTSMILIFVVISIIINILGVMSLWSISLNAVSLVNLMICIGLAVEFSIHIVKAYTFSDITKDSFRNDNGGVLGNGNSNININSRVIRVYNSLVTVGGSVFGGITLTKLIGVIVLAFARSKIFEIYYFRMWISLILIASIHSLVLLPVLLTYWGGKFYSNSLIASNINEELVNRLRLAQSGDYGDDEDEDYENCGDSITNLIGN